MTRNPTLVQYLVEVFKVSPKKSRRRFAIIKSATYIKTGPLFHINYFESYCNYLDLYIVIEFCF